MLSEAMFLLSIIPDLYPSLPDITASFIALAIFIGSNDLATEEFNKTPSNPISIILEASLGLPIPASTNIFPEHILLIISR